jgi:hypothetical protein
VLAVTSTILTASGQFLMANDTRSDLPISRRVVLR